MKVVLFCGGQGLRMGGGANDVAKPMVLLGSRPLLWHLMKYYSHWGHNEFILCLGHKGATIKHFFATYQEWISNDFVVSNSGRNLDVIQRDAEDWRITLIDTGQDACVGERLLAVRHLVENEAIFLANYSDGLTDCPMPLIVQQLENTGAVGSFMTVRPNLSLHFVNRDQGGFVTGVMGAEQAGSRINAGFFAFRPEIFDYMRPGEELVVEPFERLVKARKLTALSYDGFWRCCDTFKDRQTLENLHARGPAPWELWRRFKPGEGPAAPVSEAAAKAEPMLVV